MAQSYGIEGYLFSGAVILFIILLIYPDSLKTRKTVALKCFSDSTWLYDSWWFS